MSQMNGRSVTLLLLFLLLLGILYVYITQSYRMILCSPDNEETKDTGYAGEAIVHNHELQMPLDDLQYKQPSITQGRTDVVTVTPWLAPIIWEGTFNPVLLDSIYKPKNISIAVTVFAVGKYIMFLKNFLETAEQHFFIGYRVHVYVFTDRPNEVPDFKMAAGRQLSVRSVPSSNRWQEISARRMELIQMLIEEKLYGNSDYIFCLDVDSKFHDRWGTESLGGLVAVIHPGYYRDDRSRFPYERRTISKAYMAAGVGDFYYCGGAFGGRLKDVHLLAKTCRSNFEADAKEGVEAAWQEESHLNRYMWINKPSKVLSPEYLWQDFKERNSEIHIIRFSGVVKNYAAIRPNQ
ncbi:globoside alpha-1,3-N-acetylgalactosaminyltransferase 1-like [Parambassis ranga]|uniref:Globoside alpha-1,3-N-acetylgalactosaminyltransferase 1 n=1 Tax=Parambassis ranga TaxID=210632 RepID=A0A6P7IIZ8_9TELE|nr:globoside alpha-1,3-N-acetylgalactosaminyltransferase 1 [Parambassis ranga]XP_028268169.1 globoside alpha-1,3-N-acetylgalactosaminyltransferase 1 [Parambassis ranga]XP_028268170.1 globoside alpha-1,3-N-acetylgalactosaminyltransferase 1 [Parambassis ranga]XP_028268171.1 globoside alpha-1,3-N-acetylgalactosaminyltransferase 1 [Parambassis ranga]XP_028268172.1 globoside alpha-1,3-N-acetylgalactosaminyltransferase 1 [Parambassis ranga]XP_028268173.1 globoside alpha-1,3-N-acetylgalactosaminyltra